MKVLVTGGSGFIGSHVVDKLLAAGHEPVVFDLRPSPHHGPDEAPTIVGDLLDTGALRDAMDGCGAVIHLAASADVGIVAEEPEEAERVNARGTLAVLEAARSTGIGRVIYGSTIWAYSDSGNGNGNGVIDEDTLLGLPKHLYTASKVAGEMYCTSYAELYDVPCTILRFGIPYGPRARPSAVIPIFVRKALAGEALTIAGDGSQGRRFVYVEDLAEGVVRALDRGADNRVYNLASDTTVTIRELAETVQELVGDVDIVHTPGRNGDFDGAEISSRRAEQELGWRASTPLREGVSRYMTWLASDTQPEPVAVAEPEDLPEVAPAPAATPEPPAVRRRSGLRTTVGRLGWPAGVFGDGPTVAFACAIATLITYVIALRTRSLDDAQTHAVGLTTVVWTLGGLMLLQTASVRRLRMGVTWALWLLALYVGLMTLHWTKQKFELALPGVHTLVLSGFGLLIALAVAWGITRWRRESTASDEVL
jgi:UDP-glucose 4-epimerase